MAIIGGCGHVGLPLGLTFADAGWDVLLSDINETVIDTVQSGQMPFTEPGGQELLTAHIGKNLWASSDPSGIATVDVIICAIGTPLDEHLNPQMDDLLRAVEGLLPHLREGQLFVLRSTVVPGATEYLARWLEARRPGIDVAFCCERIAQGKSIEEIRSLPQIIAGVGDKAGKRAAEVFAPVCAELIHLTPVEAELSKLFCNSWRYLSFAVANQFYSICAERDVDFYNIFNAITHDYPRMSGLPSAGFAAGPCLFKDTMQLAAYYNNQFSMGHSGMLVNEGLPQTLVTHLQRRTDLSDKVVGILGMAFKADIDDIRDSLSFKLRKLLSFECKEVLCTDPYVDHKLIVPLEKVLSAADLVVIGSPHTVYRDLEIALPVLDPWNLLGKGGLLK